jgi:hypothetical protein
MIALGLEVCLIGLHFCFLQAENISVLSLEEVLKALLQTSSKAVYVP